MKRFTCPQCREPVAFEALACTHCDTPLAYVPESAQLVATPGRRLCANRDAAGCNWSIAENDQTYCASCRLSRWIPPLDDVVDRKSWVLLESAKRRLLYGLLRLRLPVVGRAADPQRGLSFEFLSGSTRPDGSPILTGHARGVITVRVAEANDAERGRQRLLFDEPNRTLLGHLRHEVGHYYWMRLVEGSDRLDDFRTLFGDERGDYAAAVQRHYAGGTPTDWAERTISAYAAAHPWEDWAETWAHLLERIDAVETARAVQLLSGSDAAITGEALGDDPHAWAFDALDAAWCALAGGINALNQSLGIADQYPVELPPAVLEKLRFVHATVQRAGGGGAARANPDRPTAAQPAASALAEVA